MLRNDPKSSSRPAPGLAMRLGWFVLLWLSGVASVACVAGLLRLVAT